MRKLFFVVLLLLFSVGLASCGNTDEILTEITDLKDGVEALEESLGVDIDELRDLIDELRASIDEANDAIDDLSGDLGDTNDAIDLINTDLAALELEIQALVADLLAANGKINDADLAIAQLTELVTMYIEFEAFDVEALANPLDSYFVELPNESERGAAYDISWSSESSRFVFREALVEEEIDEEMVERNAFGAVILPHRTSAQNLVLTATFTSGEFVFEKDFAVTLPASGYDSFANVESSLITTNGRIHSMIGVVYGTYTDANDNEFYLIVDVDGRTTLQDEEEVALPNAFKRVLIQETTPELEIGDEVYIIGRNTRNGTSRFFSPTMNNVYFMDTVTAAHVLSKDNETHITQTAMLAHEFTSLNEAGNSARGYEYLVSGQLFKSVEERFLPGGTDGDPLYDTDIYFMEFNDRRMEFYGLTEDQITLFDSLDGAFISIPVFYADYESMFGENLNRAHYIGDGTDIVELDAQDMMDLIVELFDRVIPEEYVSTQDQSFVLPVGRKWDATNENIEYLDVVWTTNNSDLATFSSAGGVLISAPFEEATISITALIKVFDYETGTEADPVFIETTLTYEFTLKTNMIHWDDLEVVGFTVADIDWLEGMLLDDEDPYWDTWTYGPPGERRSNQDDIRKIVDGDRTELYAAEVEARSSGANDFINIDIEFAQAETINSVLVDSGVTGNDKIRGYQLYAWDDELEDWTMIFAITNVPNNALTYHIATFDEVETTQLRIRITDSDQKNWACCYTVRLSEIQIFKAE